MITTSVVIGRTNFIEVKVLEDKVAQEGNETFAIQLVSTSLHPAGFFLTDELQVIIIDTNGTQVSLLTGVGTWFRWGGGTNRNFFFYHTGLILGGGHG